MSSSDELYKIFFSQDTPFIPDMNKQLPDLQKETLQAILKSMQQERLYIPLAISWNLIMRFNKHHEILKTRPDVLASYSTTLDDLNHYRIGYLISLELIRISFLTTSDERFASILLSQYSDIDDGKFSDFIYGNVDKCLSMFAKEARLIKYNEVFDLAATYGKEIYFTVGVIAAEKSFLSYYNAFTQNSK